MVVLGQAMDKRITFALGTMFVVVLLSGCGKSEEDISAGKPMDSKEQAKIQEEAYTPEQKQMLEQRPR